MKNNLIFLVFIVFFTLKTDPSFSQASKDSIQITSADNYYKIPKDDFDNILNNRIESQVTSKINNWIGILAGLFALLSFFGVWQIKQIFKTSVNEVTENNNKRFLSEINEVKNKIHEQRIEVKDDIKDINNAIDKRYEEFRNITTEANKAATMIEIDRIKSNQSSSINKTKLLEEKLKVVIGYNDNDFASEVIDLLGTEYFNQRSDKLIDLIEKYSNSATIKLWPRTYMNGAIDQFSLYEAHYLDVYKNKANKYCDQALDLSPGYGEAYFIKISIHAMDFSKVDDPEQQEKNKSDIKNILNTVLNSSDSVCYELIRSINFRVSHAGNKQRIEIIQSLFPDQYTKIEERSNSYESKLSV